MFALLPQRFVLTEYGLSPEREKAHRHRRSHMGARGYGREDGAKRRRKTLTRRY